MGRGQWDHSEKIGGVAECERLLVGGDAAWVGYD